MTFDKLWGSIQTILWSWVETKDFVNHSIGFSRDSLHVIASVFIFLAAALVLQKTISSFRPWLVVLLLTCGNEFVDLWAERWSKPEMQYGEGMKDLVLTMALPTLLLLTSRSFPRIYEPRQGSAPKQDAD